MGIGIWYEMWISDPLVPVQEHRSARLAARQRQQLHGPLPEQHAVAEMLQTRHNMSQTVRAEVTGKSTEWGYQLGSVYFARCISATSA